MEEIIGHYPMLKGANPTMCFLHDEPIAKSRIPPLELQIRVQAFRQPSIYLVKICSQHSWCETGPQSLETYLESIFS